MPKFEFGECSTHQKIKGDVVNGKNGLERGKKNMKYKVAGVQVSPESGISMKQIMELTSKIDSCQYEIITFEAEYAMCYFFFDYKYYEEYLDEDHLLEFKKFFVKIANDVALESEDNCYVMNGTNVYFGY